MQYTAKRISRKTWFKLERNWKLFANSNFLKWYTPGWLRRSIYIRLTVIYKLNGFSFTWLKRKSYWKTHFTESLASSHWLLRWSSALCLYTYRFSIFISYIVFKGNQLLKMLPNVWFPASVLHLQLVKCVIILKAFCEHSRENFTLVTFSAILTCQTKKFSFPIGNVSD